MSKGNTRTARQAIIATVQARKPQVIISILMVTSLIFAPHLRTTAKIRSNKRNKAYHEEIRRNYPPLSLCNVPEPQHEQQAITTTNSSISTTATATTSAQKSQSPIATNAIPDHYYKSQSGEDEMLMSWFSNLCHGTYLEMGGLDGVLFSNSFVFNKALSWKGVLIELNSSPYNEMKMNRPNEVATVHAGVCSKPQTLHAVADGPTGGIYEFASPSFREQWWKDLSLDNNPKVEKIECDTLDSLLVKHAPTTTYFDFFSLDVEGAELSVLESIDFDRVQFGIIFVEADGHNQMKNLAIRQFLEKKAGYSFLYHEKPNYWFVNPDFYEIYKHLVY
mmetsp:Transcript_24873/g.44771  ORF Transcript_24873/g.44771 Transcript_24873/m.44771 type:complete len:334 (-) Transcript_24873:156-1157(-)|eukprot:CAMPEP_0201891094 /NCGR_PEP_ID=MMETSP0902-20130614/33628_1 /ASSEMBLY_ACC=CAM_ASM_000551 /TAXON_ID=420261 /ORGANISM="Thalassiosira antarctica, Strain CCMP982" /LENGTH=333 /DNA_ID=CAMNT_0048422153 /DNA_START=73 /DNA_END=1074 /DNA_ORIENTATION=-